MTTFDARKSPPDTAQYPTSWHHRLVLLILVVVSLASFSRLFTRSSFLIAPLAIAVLMFGIAAATSRFAGPRVQVCAAWVGGAIGYVAMVSRLERRHPLLHDVRTAFRGVAHILIDQQDRLAATVPRQLAVGLFAVLIAGLTLTACASGARISALVPSFGTFCIAAVLGSTDHRWWFTIGYIAAAVAWLAITATRSTPSLSSWGASVAVSVSLALVGVLVAGTATVLSDPPLWNWRSAVDFDVPSTIRLDSLDSVSKWLRQNPQQLFTVTADHGEYWRMFALDTFDGNGWSVDADTARSNSQPGTEADAAEQMVQKITIQKLTSSELPSAFLPLSVRALRRSDSEALWMPTTQNFVLTQPTRSGDQFEVRSWLGEHPTAEPPVTSASRIDPAAVTKITSAISKIVDASAPPEEQLVQIQRWMRDGAFRYDINTAFDPRTEGVIAFLETPNAAGFCQHFATAFALIARSLGLPARVAIGFRPGKSTSVVEGKQVFSVTTSMAHAWPEVYYPERGWVPYEPTPGSASDPIRNPRDPNSLDIVAPEPPAGPTSTSAVPESGSTSALPQPSSSAPYGTAGSTSSAVEATVQPESDRTPWIVGGLLLLLLAVSGAFWLRLLRRRRLSAEIESVLPSLWRQLRERIDPVKARAHTTTTIHEEARWMSAALAPDDAATVDTLADVLSKSSFSDHPSDLTLADQVRLESEALLERLTARAADESSQRPQRRVRERTPS